MSKYSYAAPPADPISMEYTTPFSCPIVIAKMRWDKKEEYLNSLQFVDSEDYGRKQCGRTGNLLKLPQSLDLANQMIHSFTCLNESFLGYDLTNVTPYITSMWANKYTKGQSIHLHMHPNSWYSGIYYPHGTGQAAVIFESPHFAESSMVNVPRKDFKEWNSDTWAQVYAEECAIFFPSYLKHLSAPVIDDKPRYSISFNIFVRGLLSTQTETLLSI